ncbi:hypothetical protein [Streptomyces griseiscabiei]|uniref:Secreted protein n=1 Tax=Streptomyces griseiscabiei TaxID=2993540 RepID=A0ABU4LHS4_9ACTN|nr:hypothetical protein [Streptomyces griseiscabiei]MDX2915227.1 hypothetical protein [Streptomyces griseiscabiei]
MSADETTEQERPEQERPEGTDAVPAVPDTARSAPLRRVAAVAGSVVLAGALVAGVGFTVVTVRGADRDAGAATWKFPEAAAEAEAETGAGAKKAAAQPGLAALLVPYGADTWVQGPDLAEFGSDAEFSGAQATALRKESLSGLPRAQRKRLEKQIDRQRIKGMAMRSYFSGASFGWRSDEGISSVSITLARMENRTAVRDGSTFQNEFLASLDVFRDGPKIKGHDDAKCFLSPKGTDKDLDGMFCSAYAGDVLVTLTASAAKPLDKRAVAELLRTQLDRVAGQGVAV